MSIIEMRRLNLDFVEGIIIGVYGNWLISLIDKIDFESLQLLEYFLLLASFLAFILYFLLILDGRQIGSFYTNLLLIGIHYYGWLSVYLREITPEKILFSLVGLFLFFAMFVAERRRSEVL